MHNDLRNKRRLPRIEVTGKTLKIYGCVTMLLYSVSLSVVQLGILHMDRMTMQQLRELMGEDKAVMMQYSWAVMLQLLGGLAVPVFPFLLVEGFRHTGSFRKYLLWMLTFAVLSEVPFDLAMSGRAFDLTRQNAMFTLVICLIMLYGMQMFRAGTWARLLIAAAAALWSALLRTEFGLCMVLLAAVYEIFYDEPRRKLAFGCLLSFMYVTAPLSTYALSKYRGQRGEVKLPWAWYAVYPVHLLALGVIVKLIG